MVKVVVLATWLNAVLAWDSAGEVELESVPLAPVSEAEPLSPSPPEPPLGEEPGALLSSGETSVDDAGADASEIGSVIVVVIPPGWVDVRVLIAVDATLAPGLNPEAAVPDPDGAIDVPLPPGTG